MIYGPKRKRNGRWDFTFTDTDYNPPKTFPVGFCEIEYKNGNLDGHHDNPKDAVRCYFKWLLECGVTYGKYNITMLPCAICGIKTLSCATVGEKPFLILCQGHCNEKSLNFYFENNLAFEVVEEAFEHPNSPIILPESVR